jgi:hypothetical protein
VARRSSKLSVLHVDDDPGIRRAVARILGPAGVHVVAEGRGPERARGAVRPGAGGGCVCRPPRTGGPGQRPRRAPAGRCPSGGRGRPLPRRGRRPRQRRGVRSPRRFVLEPALPAPGSARSGARDRSRGNPCPPRADLVRPRRGHRACHDTDLTGNRALTASAPYSRAEVLNVRRAMANRIAEPDVTCRDRQYRPNGARTLLSAEEIARYKVFDEGGRAAGTTAPSARPYGRVAPGAPPAERELESPRWRLAVTRTADVRTRFVVTILLRLRRGIARRLPRVGEVGRCRSTSSTAVAATRDSPR